MNSSRAKITEYKRYFTGPALCVVLMLLLTWVYQVQAATSANTLINNQATASYIDSGNTARTVSSNTVQTQVQQVAGLTLTASQSKPSVAGNTIVFPHVLSNTGNGADSYNLVTTDLFPGAGIDYAFDAIRILPDVDGNGVADSTTVITQSAALDAGESYAFVIEIDVPAGATAAQIGKLTIAATSVFDAGVTGLNTDDVTVTDNAVIELSKSLSANSGLAGSGTYRVNLSYNNPSNKIATDLTIIDVLPSEMEYVGNAVWSIGTLSLTDTDEVPQGSAPSITFCAYDASCINAPYTSSQLTLVIDELGAGQSGSVSFDVSISASAVPQQIFNTANFQYDDSTGMTGLQNSNPAPFEILPTVAINIVGETLVPTAQPGQTVSFKNVITNNGNASDTFKITLDETGTTNFPAATVFVLYMADGFTPLTDTNGDGVVDTGPLAPAVSVDVILKAILPATISANTYLINKTATSENNPSISDTDVDSVTVALPVLPVDLTNNFPSGNAICDNTADSCGFGAGPAVAAQSSVSIAPGAQGVFVLYVNNLSGITDTFSFEASTDSSFTSQDLPAGWSVYYLDDADQVITGTGALASGASMRVRAVVNVGGATVAGNQSIYFRVKSSFSNAVDIKHDNVDVVPVEALQLSPDNTGQTTPGSFINYKHTLLNGGNEEEQDIQLHIANSLAATGWSASVFEDSNADGVLDAADQRIKSNDEAGYVVSSDAIDLLPGASKLLFVRVFVPANAGQGDLNLSTLTAHYNSGADSLAVIDRTTSNTFNIDLVKSQALDSDCNGIPEGDYSAASFSVLPGQCVIYQLDAQNNSSQQIINVQIYDATPAYTQYAASQPATRCTPAVCTFVTQPSSGGTGNIHAQVGNVNAGQSVRLFFNVKLEQ